MGRKQHSTGSLETGIPPLALSPASCATLGSSPRPPHPSGGRLLLRIRKPAAQFSAAVVSVGVERDAQGALKAASIGQGLAEGRVVDTEEKWHFTLGG